MFLCGMIRKLCLMGDILQRRVGSDRVVLRLFERQVSEHAKFLRQVCWHDQGTMRRPQWLEQSLFCLFWKCDIEVES